MTATAVQVAEYAAALEAARAAARTFAAVTADYRARKIGDAEYLAARAVSKAADEAFDVAFAKAAAAGVDLCATEQF